MGRHAYRCPLCGVAYECRPRAADYPPTEERVCRYCQRTELHGRWRALLERDVAEVERALPSWRRKAIYWQETAAACSYLERSCGAPLWSRDRYECARELVAQIVDCERWLARARAALA